MIASLATYPHEVLRTRIQISKQQPAAPAKPVPSAAATATAVSHTAFKGRAELYSPLVTGSNPPIPDRHVDASNHSGSHKRRGPRPGGIIDVFQKIYAQDGWRGFYRGLSINLVRTVPSSAVTMLTYELIMRNLSS